MKNKTVRIILIIVYVLTTLAGFIFAALYLFRAEFMPYHEVAVGQGWEELRPEMRVLVIALMRVSGGGWLATSVSMLLLMIIPLRRGKHWPYYGIPLIGLSVLIPTLIATLHVKAHSPANPPYLLAAVLIGLLGAALLASLICKKK